MGCATSTMDRAVVMAMGSQGQQHAGSQVTGVQRPKTSCAQHRAPEPLGVNVLWLLRTVSRLAHARSQCSSGISSRHVTVRDLFASAPLHSMDGAPAALVRPCKR
jgi:hypothetical protein